jgi:hypothetical protein
MLDDLTKQQIIDFIMEESIRIKYGKLFIQLNIMESNVVDMEVETKKRVQFNKVIKIK